MSRIDKHHEHDPSRCGAVSWAVLGSLSNTSAKRAHSSNIACLVAVFMRVSFILEAIIRLGLKEYFAAYQRMVVVAVSSGVGKDD